MMRRPILVKSAIADEFVDTVERIRWTGPTRWLGILMWRIGIWFIEKSGGKIEVMHKVERTAMINFLAVDPQEVFRSINLTSLEIEMIYNLKVDTILVGPDAATSLRDELSQMSPFRGDFEAIMNGHNGVKVRGLNLRFIPWMTGYLLLPKDGK
jgi:hypothetical protein